MKKLIALSLLLPSLAFASSVSIDGITTQGNSFTGNGSASYTGGDTLTVQLDSSDILTGGTDTNWSVTGTASNGRHTLTATAGSASASREFVVGFGGGLSPCQIDGTCPEFAKFAPTIPTGNLGGLKLPRYVKPGEEGCPIFFGKMNCIVK